MDNILTKAKEYADNALKSSIADALAKAYVDGYNDGLAAQKEKQRVSIPGQTEYVDLGLPSGTLWAADFEKDGDKYKYMSYYDAKDLPLPTSAQWKELVKYCKIGYIREYRNNFVVKCNVVGPNGRSIVFPASGYHDANMKNNDMYSSHCWIKGNEEKTNESCCIHLGQIGYSNKCYLEGEIFSIFSGYKLCVRLVKSK